MSGYYQSPVQHLGSEEHRVEFVTDNEHFIDCLEYEITGLQNEKAKLQFTIENQAKEKEELKVKIEKYEKEI